MIEEIRNHFKALLFFLYGATYQPCKSYSEFGEDVALWRLIQNKIPLGYYVDIGAYHPRIISNSALLHRNGWNGIVVDIDPVKLGAFPFSRPWRCRTKFGAIVPEAQKYDSIKIYRFGSGHYSNYDTSSIAAASMLAKRNIIPKGITEVPGISVNDFMGTLPPVDVFLIVIEGVDEQILLDLDLSKYRQKVIVFESLEQISKSLLKKFEDERYKFYFKINNSYCFHCAGL